MYLINNLNVGEADSSKSHGKSVLSNRYINQASVADIICYTAHGENNYTAKCMYYKETVH